MTVLTGICPFDKFLSGVPDLDITTEKAFLEIDSWSDVQSTHLIFLLQKLPLLVRSFMS